MCECVCACVRVCEGEGERERKKEGRTEDKERVLLFFFDFLSLFLQQRSCVYPHAYTNKHTQGAILRVSLYSAAH